MSVPYRLNYFIKENHEFIFRMKYYLLWIFLRVSLKFFKNCLRNKNKHLRKAFLNIIG